MEHKQLTCAIKAVGSDESESQWELVIEAMASTPAIDRTNEITLPTAFAETMPRFMKNPVMMFNHNPAFTIGKVLDYEIRKDGLWIKGGIASTSQGKDVANLIRAGVVSTMSFMYDWIDVEVSSDDDVPTILKTVEVYEIGPVSIPANTEAIIQQAKAKNVQLNSLSLPEAGDDERIKHMESNEVQSVVDSAVTPVKEELATQKSLVDQTATTVAEMDDRLVTKMAEIENALTDAVKSGNQTDADQKMLIEKASTDIRSVLKEMDELKGKIAANKRGAIMGGIMPTMNLKELVHVRPATLVARYGEQSTPIKELQRLNDQLLLVDGMQMARCDDVRERSDMKLVDRYKQFSPRTWDQLQDLAKAMDSDTGGEGSEFVPTGFSGNMVELIRADLKVASLFDEWTMLKNPDTIPIEGADTEATLTGQATTVKTGFDSVEQTPGSAKVVFTAQKCRARIQVSSELDEDAAINMADYTQKKAVSSIVIAIDRAIINGDNSGASHIDDGGLTVGATEFRKAWDGLRYHYQTTLTSHGVDMGTFSAEQFRKVRGEMGVYGLMPSQLACIISLKTYLQKFLKDITEVQTLKDYGPKATILTGELANIDGVPLVVSEYVSDVENASGVNDGVTEDRSEIIMVNKKSWMIGNRRNVSMEVVRDALNDIYTVVAFRRLDFQPLFTPTVDTGVIVNVGYNVTF